VDFDKGTWIEDVLAFLETCRRVGLPAAVERSRSGDGAHVWFFFSSPVSAISARKMGCYLITETMSQRHELSMESYDRLFPSQDTMPRGGFGNLIALPLQHGPRASGNSAFLDEELRVYPDDQQWSYLASIPRIDAAAVELIARKAADQGSIVGLSVAALDDEETTPWARPPSRKRRPAVITGPLPAVVRAVLAQKLFVSKAGLPSPLINEIKRLAAFQNPEFYKKQLMRLSTIATPRVIHAQRTCRNSSVYREAAGANSRRCCAIMGSHWRSRTSAPLAFRSDSSSRGNSRTCNRLPSKRCAHMRSAYS
jgi:hypothetical protein